MLQPGPWNPLNILWSQLSSSCKYLDCQHLSLGRILPIYMSVRLCGKGTQHQLLVSLQSSWLFKSCPSDPCLTSDKVSACSTGSNWHLCPRDQPWLHLSHFFCLCLPWLRFFFNKLAFLLVQAILLKKQLEVFLGFITAWSLLVVFLCIYFYKMNKENT